MDPLAYPHFLAQGGQTMKAVYPVIFTQLNDGYMAYSPDFEINTQGGSLTDAIEMMRDAIGLMGIDMQDEKKKSLLRLILHRSALKLEKSFPL